MLTVIDPAFDGFCQLPFQQQRGDTRPASGDWLAVGGRAVFYVDAGQADNWPVYPAWTSVVRPVVAITVSPGAGIVHNSARHIPCS